MANEKQKTPRKSRSDDTLLMTVVQQYFKLAGLVAFIWFVGYFGFSLAWLLLGLVVYVWKEKHKKQRQLQIQISQETAKNEKAAILARVEDLPSWVFFPDVERAEWLNKMIEQMWPFIGDYVEDMLKTTVEPKVQQSLPASISSFKFAKIDMGDIPPRIGGVKVYTEHVRRDEIYMDLDIIYSSDSMIEVKLKGITAGIKDLCLHGTLRVIFKPLIGQIPLFGGMSVFFLNNPTIDFNLTSLANALDLPGLNDMLQTIIQEQVANFTVLPNRISIPMVQNLNLSQLRFPQPDGVVRVHVIEAKDLKKADISLTGKGKSDPYVVVKVGAQKFKTKVINNSVAPKWNAVYEAIIDVKDGQFLEMEVKDEDPGSKDDDLGGANFDLSPVSKKGMMDSWLPLEDVKTGMVHVKLVWLYLAKDPMVLDKICQEMKKDPTQEELSSCILMVNLDSARELPRSKKQMQEPSPFVSMSVGQKKEESKVMYDTTDPRWEQGFRFLVHDPHFQTLDLKITDKKSDKFLGELSFPLKNLLTAPDMVIDRYFDLKKSESGSQVMMRLALRVLTTEFNPEWTNESEDLIMETKPETEEKTPAAAGAATGTEKKPAAGQEGTVTSSTAPITKSEAPKVSRIPQASSSPPGQTKGAGDSELRQRKSTSPSSPSSTSEKGVYGHGRIQLTLRYSAQRTKLIIVVHKCVNLIPCDSDQLADPYVKLYLLPDKSSSGKRKTKEVKNNLNPVFDETFEFDVTQAQLPSRDLEVSIKNETSFFSSNKKVMGGIVIDLSKFDISKAVTEWFDLMPEEDSDKPVAVQTDV